MCLEIVAFATLLLFALPSRCSCDRKEIYGQRNMKKLMEQYNHRDSLIMISLYPKRGELYSAGTSGVASYAKNVVKHMDRKIVVLADYQNKKEMYEEDNILVYRCFKRNTSFMWISLIKALLQFRNAKNVLLQLDFAVYGSVLTTSFVIPFLGFLKMLGFKISVTMHHVVLDVFKLKGHVGIKNGIKDQIKGKVYNFLFHGFYFFLGIVANQIIVLEEILKKKLNTFISDEKVVTIPHGVDTELSPIPKNFARKRLGIGQDEYVILFFGFINWFKGADCFVDTYKDVEKILGRRTRFIVAGGESPTLKDRPYYQEYYSDVVAKIQDSKSIEITGYIPQEKIAAYFSAADLIVLPYRHFMTASGVLSLVFSYKRPFMISNQIGKMFQSADFTYALNQADLNISDLVFELKEQSAVDASENVLKNGIKKKMEHMAEIMRDLRSYENTAKMYEQVLMPSSSLALISPLNENNK